MTTGAVSAPRPHAAAALPTVVACPGTAASLRARSFPAGCAARTPLAAAGAASAAGPAVADHLAENQRHNDYKNRGDNNCSHVICEPCHDKCLLCLFPLSVAPLLPVSNPRFLRLSMVSAEFRRLHCNCICLFFLRRDVFGFKLNGFLSLSRFPLNSLRITLFRICKTRSVFNGNPCFS